MKIKKQRYKVTFIVAALILVAAITGCTTDAEQVQPEAVATDVVEEAEEISEEAQDYIDQARDTLATALDEDRELIELESVTEPPNEDSPYIIRLTIDDKTYEFHGRNNEVLPVSELAEELSETADPSVHTEADLVSLLEDAGADVALSTEQIVAADILSIPGHIIFVNGEELQLYIYDTADDAITDAERISPDASEIVPETVGDAAPTIVDWDGQPNFYRWDNILVLYVGEDGRMLNLLETIFGEPFAG